MPDYRSDRSRGLVPYTAGEQPQEGGFIKINTNENPYPPAPGVAEAVREAAARLPLYPPTDGGALREALAEYHGVSKEWVFCGNGSDEVLGFAYLAFFGPDKPLCSPELTYSFYPVYARLFGAPYTSVPMKGDGLSVDLDALLAQGDSVALANPNAPTSIALARRDVAMLARALRARGQLLLLDEAYAAFAKEDCAPLVQEFDNLLIVRTLSKSHALAGLRAGYALGQPELVQALIAVKDSFNSYPLDHLAIAAASAAVRDTAYLAEITAKVVATRDRFTARLREMGFVLPDSSTNFVFATHPAHPAQALFAALRERRILVRHFNTPPIAEYLRISIGSDADMEAVAGALEEILRGRGA